MIRFTFLKRLKARFRPSRPSNAPDTVSASEVRDWIVEVNAKTLHAALAADAGRPKPTELGSKYVFEHDAAGNITGFTNSTNGKTVQIVADNFKVRPQTTAHPDYAEIIRIADALYRLAGVKK